MQIRLPVAPWSCLLAVVAVLAMPVTAYAEATYPDHPIRFIVPFPPGGGADNPARVIVPKATQILGQAIVIENKPGAGGNIGAAEVARAAPDGYTLLQGTHDTHGMNQARYQNTGFDPLKDFAPVARFTVPAMPVIHPQVPVSNVRELVASGGVYAPAGTPKPIIDTQNAAFRQALDEPAGARQSHLAWRVSRPGHRRRSGAACGRRISDVDQARQGLRREGRLMAVRLRRVLYARRAAARAIDRGD